MNSVFSSEFDEHFDITKLTTCSNLTKTTEQTIEETTKGTT